MSDERPTDPWGVLHVQGNRGSVSFERKFATSVADLWEIVTVPERIEPWFCAVTGDFHEGGEYHTDMGTDGIVSGRILECRPPHRYLITWDEGKEQSSEIEVRVDGDAGSAALFLEHRGLPAEYLADYGAGWQGYLEVMESRSDGLAEWSTDRYQALLPPYHAEFERLR